MDFMEYHETGEESPDKNKQTIDEGLVDVMFATIRSNMKTSVSGPLVYFRWEWMNTKTFFTLRIKKTTLRDFLSWLNGIMEDADDKTK